VFKNVVITGGNNGEQAPSAGLYGDIRGWDARTGTLLWSFHTVPRAGRARRRHVGRRELEESFGHQRLVVLHHRRRARPRLRAARVANLRLLRRRSQGREPVRQLDRGARRADGKPTWYRQLVHHDLWDYDLPAAPTLFDVKRNGRTVPAVGVITKMGLLFIFDRVTGEPIFGIESGRCRRAPCRAKRRGRRSHFR
jgi:quinoprotein glucose dehydrogenase